MKLFKIDFSNIILHCYLNTSPLSYLFYTDNQLFVFFRFVMDQKFLVKKLGKINL